MYNIGLQLLGVRDDS